MKHVSMSRISSGLAGQHSEYPDLTGHYLQNAGPSSQDKKCRCTPAHQKPKYFRTNPPVNPHIVACGLMRMSAGMVFLLLKGSKIDLAAERYCSNEQMHESGQAETQPRGSPETLAVSGWPAPSRLPTRIVEAVAIPNGKDRNRKTDSVSMAVWASTSIVPAHWKLPDDYQITSKRTLSALDSVVLHAKAADAALCRRPTEYSEMGHAPCTSQAL